jgi:hypothetical protein
MFPESLEMLDTYRQGDIEKCVDLLSQPWRSQHVLVLRLDRRYEKIHPQHLQDGKKRD